ncbi:MAG: cyclic nucleotide-binding domain-containing protein [Anaerolineae bacterium]|nr:cyclic nucleotide-binding domain-containing protein [Anaerolineae bacterium]
MITVSALKRVEILSDLSDAQLTRVAQICKIETFKSGDIIVREFEPSDEIYIINKGSAQVQIGASQVTAETLAAPGPMAAIAIGQGQIFGEMSLIDMGPRSATVQCTSDGTEMYVIRRDEFVSLCEQDTDIGYRVMRNLAADLSFKLRHRNLSWK